MTRTAVPPPTEPISGVKAYTTAADVYSNTTSETNQVSPLELADTSTGPPSRAGDVHSAPYPAARPVNGPIVPKRQADTAFVSPDARASLTVVPPS